MPYRRLAMIVALLGLTASRAPADQNPTIAGTTAPTASEAAFIRASQTDLRTRFATPADAEAAGYFRYTNADDTGAISYANLHWSSRDAAHPSQLWYGKSGELLGADYSVLKTGSARPQLWGVRPGRWTEFGEHLHFVTKNPRTGAMGYDKYVDPISKYVAAGGDPMHPDAGVLVKMHLVASKHDVVKIFDFPAIWDLIVWVKENPSGAFAEKDPLVKS